MIRSWPSVLIGLGIPTLAIIGGISLLAHQPVEVHGIPIMFCWMFCCFPLTTLCLWVSWRFFDSRAYPEDH